MTCSSIYDQRPGFRKRVEVGWQGNPDDISELIKKLAEIEWAMEALVPGQVGVLACSL